MNTLTLYRSAVPTVTIDIDEKTYFSQRVMTEHRVVSDFYTTSVLDITIGDYITINLENLYINRLPGITKIHNAKFLYHIEFESVMYDLKKKLFMSIDNLAEYGRTGTAQDFMNDIITNMNTVGFSSGWTSGTVDITGGEKTVVFTNESCMAALVKVAQEYALEFTLTGKSISLIKSVGTVTAVRFEYGKGLGLYKLERQQVQDQNIVTKVFGFGSMTNIPETYRNRAKRLVFSTDGPYTSPPSGFGGGDRYITKNESVYGVIEGQYTNDDIFPSRTGTVGAVNMAFTGEKYNPLTSYVEDTTIDFNIATSKIDGASGPPSIVFKSGDLAGQEFEIWKYDDTLKRIYFNPNVEEDGYTTPNPTNIAITGNTYTLVNIALPQAYIDDAEEKLLTETATWLDDNCVPKVVYTVDIDPVYAATNQIVLNAGDRVTVVDSALGVNNLIRVSAVSYPLTNTYKIKAMIADFVPYTQQERVIIKTVTTEKDTKIVDRTADELTRRHSMRMAQLRDLIFDADGYFDATRIKPLSIETMYLSVGASSTNFHLNGVRIKPNYLGDENAIYISAGELVHHVFSIGNDYTWIIQAAAVYEDLDPLLPYYLYAKISKTQLTGQWDLSPDKKATDGQDGFYYLLCGILYAVMTDGTGTWRDFDFTYGMTYINGRTITTGRIQTINQLNYIDLDTNQFRIGDSNSGIDWNVTSPNILTILGGLVQRTPDDTPHPVSIFRGAYSALVTYYNGDYVTFNGDTWMYINTTPTMGTQPVEGAYWTQLITATQGDPGVDGSSPVGIFRGIWNEGTDYYGTGSRVDIVYYETSQLYYIAKPTAGNPFRGVVPTDTAYWDAFGANFESVATSLLFAELAFVENLGVRFFEGVPVVSGNLDGIVTATQANVIGVNKIVAFTLSGSEGQGNITLRGVSRPVAYMSTLTYTAEQFVSRWYYFYLGVGVTLSSIGNVIYAEGTDGEDITDADYTQTTTDLSMIVTTDQAYSLGQKRIDTITLSGTGGVANILCDGLTRNAMWAGSLSATANAFYQAYASAYLANNVVVTADGADIIFTSQYKGVDFTGPTQIENYVTNYNGAVSIEGNHIWEDKTNSSVNSVLLINMRGYLGGAQYFRQLCIGDGKGKPVMSIGGNSIEAGDGSYINIDAETIRLDNLPTSSAGLFTGRVWRDANGFLRII